MFKWLNSYGANNVVKFSCTIKTKVFAVIVDDIVEEKEVYIQQSLEDIRGS